MAGNKTMDVTLYLQHIATPITVSLHEDGILDLMSALQYQDHNLEKLPNGMTRIELGDREPEGSGGYLDIFLEDVRAMVR